MLTCILALIRVQPATPKVRQSEGLYVQKWWGDFSLLVWREVLYFWIDEPFFTFGLKTFQTEVHFQTEEPLDQKDVFNFWTDDTFFIFGQTDRRYRKICSSNFRADKPLGWYGLPFNT